MLALGDMVDGFFWGSPAQDSAIGNLEEQHEFMRAAMREVKGKVLVGWSGDHDGWKKKAGPSDYKQFEEETGAHYMEGVGYVDLQVGEQEYKIAACHRHLGHSIYTHSHPSQRLFRDSATDADMTVVAHTHKKGLTQQVYQPGFDREPRLVTHMVVGPYKRSDEYCRKRGFSRQSGDQLGGMSVILHPDKKLIEPKWTVREK